MCKTKRKIVSDIHVLIHVFIHVNACHLLRSSRVSNSWAPLVPFSPVFSGFSFASCPRSSFRESVSVTVLGENCQQGFFSGIFFSFFYCGLSLVCTCSSAQACHTSRCIQNQQFCSGSPQRPGSWQSQINTLR